MPDYKIGIKVAQDHLKMAKIFLGLDEISLRFIFFDLKLCAEKSLKAYLVYQDQGVKKSHDLSYLLRECARFNHDFLRLSLYAEELNPFSEDIMYPDYRYTIPDVIWAKKCYIFAEEILSFVEQEIEKNKSED